MQHSVQRSVAGTRAALQPNARRAFSDTVSSGGSSSVATSGGSSSAAKAVTPPVAAADGALQRAVRAPGALFKSLTQTAGRTSSATYSQLPDKVPCLAEK